MEGAPSPLDMFDDKPALYRYDGAGGWLLVPGSSVDTVLGVVSGATTSDGIYGLGVTP